MGCTWAEAIELAVMAVGVIANALDNNTGEFLPDAGSL